jgi:phosphatidate cytidylyltransferase
VPSGSTGAPLTAPRDPPPRVQTDVEGSLRLRAASGAVLAALALAVVFVGGWPFVSFWAAAGLGIFLEWSAIVAGGAALPRAAGICALLLAAAACGSGHPAAALVFSAVGAAVAAALGPAERRAWTGSGVLYAAAVLLAPDLLRRDQEYGTAAMLFMFAVVWATDIFGFFAGRYFDGPKLAPRISPNKTWAGACGGTVGAIAVGIATLLASGIATPVSTACLAFSLSIVSQMGDLFESAVKRRFGVKDASRMIPGHGGLMDRLDGFLAAAAVAALVGLARGGADASAHGLLLW